MRRILPDLVIMTFLLVLILPVQIQAEDPTLAVRLTGGGDSYYEVSEIERLTFGGDSLWVVATSGSDSYVLSGLWKLEFYGPSVAGVASRDEVSGWPEGVWLRPGRPNPFSPSTRIGFDLPHAGRVELKIYSAEGRLVRTLLSGVRSAGTYSVEWNGCDDEGNRLASGTYFCRLNAPRLSENRKLILVK